MKKTPLGIFFLYLTFAITRLKIELIEKCEKTTFLAQNGFPSPREPHGGEGVRNVLKSRCYQNLSITVYRIEIGPVEKKDKIR